MGKGEENSPSNSGSIGKGCPLCKHTGWIEVLGGGVVNRKVLEVGGTQTGAGVGTEQFLHEGIQRTQMCIRDRHSSVLVKS